MEALPPIFVGLLLLARLLPIIELTPVLADPWVPRTVRLGLAVGLAALLAPLAAPPAMFVELPGVVDALLLLGRELGIGLAIGFLGSLVFEGARMAGGIVDRLMSVGRGAEDGPVARLYVLTAAVLFFATGGARLWVYALGRSYEVVALDAAVSVGDGLALARVVADVITLAVLLALPVLAVVLLAELVAALAARVSRVFRAGVPPASIRTLVAVAALALSFGVFADELGGAVVAAMDELPAAIEGLDVR